MQTCTSCGTKKPTDKYTQVEMNLSNGSRMPVAVCVDCKDDVFSADRKAIMDAVRAGWIEEQIRDKWSKERMADYARRFGSLEIVD